MQEHIVGYTLIDISDASALQRQNLNSLLQCISLRANPMNIKILMMPNQPMADYEFGDNFGGNHNVWMCSFTVEQSLLYENKKGALGGVHDDVHQVPIIANLLESATIDPEIFDSQDSNKKNIYFNRQSL